MSSHGKVDDILLVRDGNKLKKRSCSDFVTEKSKSKKAKDLEKSLDKDYDEYYNMLEILSYMNRSDINKTVKDEGNTKEKQAFGETTSKLNEAIRNKFQTINKKRKEINLLPLNTLAKAVSDKYGLNVDFDGVNVSGSSAEKEG